jgi:uncharacterized membrane protein YphA (DoxX/SURF4 family)
MQTPPYRKLKNWTDLLYTEAPGWSILVRLLVGLVVFLPEGIQKQIFPDVLGAGRFAKIGIPFPDVMGPFVGIGGDRPRLACYPGAFHASRSDSADHYYDCSTHLTKLPILLGHDVWMFHLAQDIKRTGFWSMMHEARADLTMLLGCIYLLIAGAGRWSLDGVIKR